MIFAFPKKILKLFGTAGILCFTVGHAQNIVDVESTISAANPAKLTEMDFSEFLFGEPQFRRPPESVETTRAAAKLDRTVAQFIEGFPWKPFHHTLGISGAETCFDHPDEMFYALALSLPCLTPPTADRARNFLAQQLGQTPPYSQAGFERGAGQTRESYDVPDSLRVTGRGTARSAFGVYAFWAYCHYAGDTAAARTHWPAIKKRADQLIREDYRFNIERTDFTNDEPETLNGDLAGALALVRLARMNGDDEFAVKATARTRQLLELRLNFERLNTKVVQKTSSSSKHLHVYKLARYCGVVPEVGEALRKWSAGCAAARLKAFREERNGWFLAFGDRLIGGENYTNPTHFSRALFSGAVLVEKLPPAQIDSFVDVPWCKGDFYFMEKCALALGSH